MDFTFLISGLSVFYSSIQHGKNVLLKLFVPDGSIVIYRMILILKDSHFEKENSLKDIWYLSIYYLIKEIKFIVPMSFT